MTEPDDVQELRQTMRRNTRRAIAGLAVSFLLLAVAVSWGIAEAAQSVNPFPLVGWAEQPQHTATEVIRQMPKLRSDGESVGRDMGERGRGWLNGAGQWVDTTWCDFLDRQRLALCVESAWLSRSAEHPPEVLDQLDETLERVLGFSLEEKLQSTFGWLHEQAENLPVSSQES